MKTRIQSILIVIMFLFPGVLARVQAVSPAPDGCYPKFTTAEGCDALGLLTTGAGNTGLGWRSLFFDSPGSFNTGVGGGALATNDHIVMAVCVAEQRCATHGRVRKSKPWHRVFKG